MKNKIRWNRNENNKFLNVVYYDISCWKNTKPFVVFIMERNYLNYQCIFKEK